MDIKKFLAQKVILYQVNKIRKLGYRVTSVMSDLLAVSQTLRKSATLRDLVVESIIVYDAEADYDDVPEELKKLKAIISFCFYLGIIDSLKFIHMDELYGY